MRRLILCVAVLLCGVGQVQADVEVVEGNIVFSGPYSDAPDYYNYAASVYQDAAAEDYTCTDFDYDGLNLAVTAYCLDEGSDWYLVNEGDQFSRENIDNGLFPALKTYHNQFPPVFVGSGEFYLGMNTGLGWLNRDEDPWIPNRDVYGWVHIGNVDGELVQIGDATAYGAEGIIVGTTQAIVPEPSTIIMLLTGAVGLLACARRRRRAV